MKKQARKQHRSRRGQRLLPMQITPELARELLRLGACVLQCLLDYGILNEHDVAEISAQNPPHSARRLR